MLLAKTLRSSTFKLALIYIVIFGAIVVGLIGYVYWSASSFVESRLDRTTAAELALLQSIYAEAGRGALIEAINRRVADRRLEGAGYLLADASFAPLAGNLGAWPSALRGSRGSGNFSAGEGKPMLRATFITFPDGSHLLVGQDAADFEAFAQRIGIVLALCLGLIFLLAGVASLTVTRRTVGRIEAINATSRAIMLRGLGERIPLRDTRDEWDELAANLNSMLDRIEALVRQVKQVTDNVAHDLRTPLARIRGRLERAYSRPRSGDENESLIGDTLTDLDAVLGMFTSITRISQIEAYRQTSAFRRVDLVQIACEVVELFDAAAEVRGAILSTAGDRSVFVYGDRDLLFDALANLVDNAIKHGRESGHVIVDVKKRNDGASLAVIDDGPGIPAKEFQTVFNRFYRLERSRAAPGNGLGLSLVAAVARLHSATIEMFDNSPGLKFQLLFPSPMAADMERGFSGRPGSS